MIAPYIGPAAATAKTRSVHGGGSLRYSRRPRVCVEASLCKEEEHMRLVGKVALITGGASGMGQSEAGIFARGGARGMVADVLEFEGRPGGEKIAAAGGQARVVERAGTRGAGLQGAGKGRPAGLRR